MESKSGCGLVAVCAQIGWKRGIKLLIRLGFDLDMQNFKGNTALHFAEELGHTEVVRCLVKKGARCDLINELGFHYGQRPVEGTMWCSSDVESGLTNE